MENMLKTLIIITLCYYLLKGLIYLMLWQTTVKLEERARAEKNKKKAEKEMEEELWRRDNFDEEDDN
jgi:uncharacterized membrane protein